MNEGKIILLFEGIDFFVNIQTLEYIPVDFWLPKEFPDRVRVILTLSQNSEYRGYFQRQGCNIITVQNNVDYKAQIVQELSTKYKNRTVIEKLKKYQEKWPCTVFLAATQLTLQ